MRVREFPDCILALTGRALLLPLLVVFSVGPVLARAEDKFPSAPEVQTYPVPDPQVYDNAMSRHRSIERARIALNTSISVDLLERPRSIDDNDSILVLRVSSQPPKTFHIGHLIGHPQLRVVHTALVHTDSNSGMLVLEYEGGAVGAREGFAVLRYDRQSAQLHVLPLTDYGKVVVFRQNQGLAEIWSGDCANSSLDSDGCKYTTRMCTWKDEGYSCGHPLKKDGKFNQGDISDPGIEIRP